MSGVKAKLKEELLAHLQADLQAVERAHRATQEGATHEEARPENDKDTRALEQSYLARGQASRVLELRAQIAEVAQLALREFEGAPAALGALVTVEDEDGATQDLFLASAGGGARLGEGAVQVVTPQSPLGRAILGRREGEETSFLVRGKAREMRVVRVR